MTPYEFFRELRDAGVIAGTAHSLATKVLAKPIEHLKAHQILMDYFIWMDIPPPNEGLSWNKVHSRLYRKSQGLPMDAMDGVETLYKPVKKPKPTLPPISINQH